MHLQTVETWKCLGLQHTYSHSVCCLGKVTSVSGYLTMHDALHRCLHKALGCEGIAFGPFFVILWTIWWAQVPQNILIFQAILKTRSLSTFGASVSHRHTDCLLVYDYQRTLGDVDHRSWEGMNTSSADTFCCRLELKLSYSTDAGCFLAASALLTLLWVRVPAFGHSIANIGPTTWPTKAWADILHEFFLLELILSCLVMIASKSHAGATCGPWPMAMNFFCQSLIVWRYSAAIKVQAHPSWHNIEYCRQAC